MPDKRISLSPAALELDTRGVAYSRRFEDVYHSADGGAEQARHVFIRGNGLPGRWGGRRGFTIVETGFGLGLNFLETWRAWEDDPARCGALHYVSVEAQPFSGADLARAHAGRVEHAARLRAVRAAWPPLIRGFHRLHFSSPAGRITLTLLFGDAQALLPELAARADALYLDGFAPAKNPQLWTPAVFTALARLCAPGATVATWSVASGVREGLTSAGFRVEKRPGFGAKRDMLAGVFESAAADSNAGDARHALVLGAGLAGTACAQRLAARGWSVDLLERAPAPARGASGNPLGLAAPLLNLADGANARFSRAAFFYALRHFHALGEGVRLVSRGVLRVGRDERDAERFARLLDELGVPPELASYADATESAARAGRSVSRPGLWLPDGVTLAPAELCSANLAAAKVNTHFNADAARLEHRAGHWRALDGNGSTLASAPVAVIANAVDARNFEQARYLALEAIRGQVTVLPPRRLDAAVTGEAHALPLPDGRILIGAGFQPGDMDLAVRSADHAANMARIEAQLPGFCESLDPAALQGRAAFRTVTPDRLPIFGPLGNEHNLYVATGLGARGLVWAPLGAELIAAQLCGEPWPIEHELALAVTAGRFAP